MRVGLRFYFLLSSCVFQANGSIKSGTAMMTPCKCSAHEPPRLHSAFPDNTPRKLQHALRTLTCPPRPIELVVYRERNKNISRPLDSTRTWCNRRGRRGAGTPVRRPRLAPWLATKTTHFNGRGATRASAVHSEKRNQHSNTHEKCRHILK